MPQQAIQRLGVGSELPGLLTEMGADAASLFAEIGVTLSDVTPDLRLAFPRLLHLLDRAAKVTACGHLGILLGLRFRLHQHGIIGALMGTAPTLQSAVEDFVTWQPGYSSGAIVYLHRSGPDHAFGYGLYTRTIAGADVLYDTVIAVGVRLAQILTRNGVEPVEILLNRRAPANASAYSRLLRADVRFNQTRSCIIFDEAAMQTNLPDANPAKRREILDMIAASGRWPSHGLGDRVRKEIRHALLSGPPRMPAIADRLGLEDRTLRRKLKAEGTTFTLLNDEVRLAVAQELLDLTSLSMGEIAAATGFASASVFAETFRKWTGTTATRLRGERKG